MTLALALAATSLVPLSNASADQDVDFEVNIEEILTVSLTNPTSWASGNVDTLLRNKVTVSAMTNNYYGVTLSMYADNTDLRNVLSYSSTDSTSYIDTLDASTYTYSTFPSNAWGYSVEDADTAVTSASYLPITTSSNPVTLFTNTPGTSGTTYSKDVFFGAKATSAKQSGTYAQTVNFVAVTGVIDTDDNPVVPDNPSTDNSDSEIASNTASYSSTTGRTTYTTRGTNTTDDTTTTTTEVVNGDATSAYANAAGVTSHSGNGSALATALAVAAGTMAVSGLFFFILAKRNDDDDEDEDEE